MKLAGFDIHWSDHLERRSLDQITQADIGLAFDDRMDRLSGLLDFDPAAFFRGRQLTADTVASLPMQELSGTTVIDEPSTLLTAPNPDETYHDTLSQLMFDLIDGGDAGLRVRTFDSNGRPRTVQVVNQEEVIVAWDRKQLERVYSWRNQPMIEGRNYFHISINRKATDLRGRGVIEAAADTTLAALRAQGELAASLAEDNYTPTMLLKHPSVKTTDDANRVRDMFIGGRDRARRKNIPAAGGADLVVEQMTINPVDAQWVESRAFEVQEAARYFGLPGWFLLVDQGSSMTYSNTEGVMRFWATTTLRPTYLERIEQTFSRMLADGRRARFDLDEILRADQEARYRAYEMGIRSEFILPNEARQSEGLAPIAGGDGFSRSREIAEIIQRIYLGVGTVLSDDEARRIVSAAGVSLPGGIPTVKEPSNA